MLTVDQQELLRERGYSDKAIADLQAGVVKPEARSSKKPAPKKRFAVLGPDATDDDIAAFVKRLKQ